MSNNLQKRVAEIISKDIFRDAVLPINKPDIDQAAAEIDLLYKPLLNKVRTLSEKWANSDDPSFFDVEISDLRNEYNVLGAQLGCFNGKNQRRMLSGIELKECSLGLERR